ncbi:hypothetical protein HK101_004583, partial [Irineochytrium annulatum]
ASTAVPEEDDDFSINDCDSEDEGASDDSAGLEIVLSEDADEDTMPPAKRHVPKQTDRDLNLPPAPGWCSFCGDSMLGSRHTCPYPGCDNTSHPFHCPGFVVSEEDKENSMLRVPCKVDSNGRGASLNLPEVYEPIDNLPVSDTPGADALVEDSPGDDAPPLAGDLPMANLGDALPVNDIGDTLPVDPQPEEVTQKMANLKPPTANVTAKKGLGTADVRAVKGAVRKAGTGKVMAAADDVQFAAKVSGAAAKVAATTTAQLDAASDDENKLADDDDDDETSLEALERAGYITINKAFREKDISSTSFEPWSALSEETKATYNLKAKWLNEGLVDKFSKFDQNYATRIFLESMPKYRKLAETAGVDMLAYYCITGSDKFWTECTGGLKQYEVSKNAMLGRAAKKIQRKIKKFPVSIERLFYNVQTEARLAMMENQHLFNVPQDDNEDYSRVMTFKGIKINRDTIKDRLLYEINKVRSVFFPDMEQVKKVFLSDILHGKNPFKFSSWPLNHDLQISQMTTPELTQIAMGLDKGRIRVLARMVDSYNDSGRKRKKRKLLKLKTPDGDGVEAGPKKKAEKTSTVSKKGWRKSGGDNKKVGKKGSGGMGGKGPGRKRVGGRKRRRHEDSDSETEGEQDTSSSSPEPDMPKLHDDDDEGEDEAEEDKLNPGMYAMPNGPRL